MQCQVPQPLCPPLARCKAWRQGELRGLGLSRVHIRETPRLGEAEVKGNRLDCQLCTAPSARGGRTRPGGSDVPCSNGALKPAELEFRAAWLREGEGRDGGGQLRGGRGGREDYGWCYVAARSPRAGLDPAHTD